MQSGRMLSRDYFKKKLGNAVKDILLGCKDEILRFAQNDI